VTWGGRRECVRLGSRDSGSNTVGISELHIEISGIRSSNCISRKRTICALFGSVDTHLEIEAAPKLLRKALGLTIRVTSMLILPMLSW
jgi:hypothetical protein